MSLIASQDWLSNPHTSGLLLFLIGGWILLATYHFLLFIQNRNKLYFLYGSYLVSICAYQAFFLNSLYIYKDSSYLFYLFKFPEFWAETSYLIYFLFAFKFLDLKSEFPKSYKYIMNALKVITIFCIVTFFIHIISNDKTQAGRYYHFFVIYILILSIITYGLFFKSRHPLRFYIIVGSLMLSICSVLSLILVIIYSKPNSYIQWPYSILYLGYLLETLLFALGLGHLQYRILNERNQTQQKLIFQLQENDQLRVIQEEKLEKEIEQLNLKAELDKLDAIKMQYEMELTNLKFSALRNQMNPHFIFNSLNSIKRYIIENEKENAVYYLNKFSKLIRKILSSTTESTISLSEEIEIANLYVNIENIRFNSSIKFVLEVEEHLNLETIKVPSLILQPFLENAIWHGLSNIKSDKLLSLTIQQFESNFLLIKIYDNGIGRDRAREIKQKKIHKRDSIGLKLTEDRLKTFSMNFDNNYSLKFNDLFDSDAKAIGTEVILKIPIR